MKLQKFIPLQKMEETQDGTLLVFGTVTAEKPDLDKEVCDYKSTKLYYEKRRDENLKKTSLPGMTPSMMPFREMHQAKTQGAARIMVFDDDAKVIKMGFEVVSPDAIKMWKAGCFVGFSQGGSYVEQWPDPEYEGCTRYTADPFEVSAVDSPCLPSALVESMKGRTVEMCKSSGVTERVPLQLLGVDEARMIKMERELDALRELVKGKTTKRVDGADLTASCFAHVGDPEDPSTWKLPIHFPGDEEKTKSHIRDALARFEQTDGMSEEEKKSAKRKILAAAKDQGIEVSESEKAAVARACAKIALEKGLFEVGYLADILESLTWLCLQTEWERDFEDDGSKIPEGIRGAWLELIEQFKGMAVEEADELAALGGKKEKGMKIETQEQFAKATKSMHDHLGKLLEMHKSNQEHMEKAHAAIQDRHEKLGEHIEKCMKACKEMGEGEETEREEKSAPSGDMSKVAALEAQVAELCSLVKRIPASIPPHTGVNDFGKVISPFDDLIQ